MSCPFLEKEQDPNYASYLKLDQLLVLQEPRSPSSHDEMLFIIVHQVYELWFKQVLFEINALMDHLKNDKIINSLKTLKRIRTIFKLIVAQMDVLETMTSHDFNEFRPYLGESSGFQSFQFRELETMLGIRGNKAENLWSVFLDFIRRNLKISQTHDLKNDAALLAALYQEESLLNEIAEYFLDIDEGLQEWRYRHVKMVERTIGPSTAGTGGSSGAAYLRTTLSLSFCPLLWTEKQHCLVS
jgi:tryptophan 2,3-dioxygenase